MEGSTEAGYPGATAREDSPAVRRHAAPAAEEEAVHSPEPAPRLDTPANMIPMFFRLMTDRSTGSTNDALVDHLKASGSLRDPRLEQAFRRVDRQKFLPQGESSSEAYDDAPVRDGHFHMSQPSLYADALTHLDLRPGLSFLNVGGGTGYFSSMVSEIVGSGLHHGVDLHKEVLDHAREMFRQQGKDYIEFFQVNVHDLDLDMCPRYDRIYLGACAGGESKQILKLLQVGGVLVGPFETATGQYIRKVTRKSESKFEIKNLKQVSFGRLLPSLPDAKPFVLPARPWTPETHSSFTPRFKAAVMEVLFCTMRQSSPAHILPREIFVKHVFGFMHPNWFNEATDASFTESLDGGEEQAMGDEGSFDEDADRHRIFRMLALFAHEREQRIRRQMAAGRGMDSDEDDEQEAPAEQDEDVEMGTPRLHQASQPTADGRTAADDSDEAMT
eukprot:TRINITY_DN15192_c0_g1_i1.p1 TRINITY_DN15192_c0_g1~~TRINITY_DN15192_c0_g1_i1.p1  ORF type:complete len:444 (+),score=101.69 TRINITY_DN15192_c0_g1_i1:38-1369(+)